MDDAVPIALDEVVWATEPDSPLKPVATGLVEGLLVPVALVKLLFERLRSDATLRPRNVSRVMTALADSPLPPASASHRSIDWRMPLAAKLLGMSCVTLANTKQPPTPVRRALSASKV